MKNTLKPRLVYLSNPGDVVLLNIQFGDQEIMRVELSDGQLWNIIADGASFARAIASGPRP